MASCGPPRDTRDAILRREAEERLHGLRIAGLPVEADRLIHDLSVHQIELEMQNEHLREMQVELEASRDRYADLYDSIPVGYFTITAKGLIKETNLFGAAMLGAARDDLSGRRLGSFIEETSEVAYLRYRREVLGGKTGRCDLRMRREDGTGFVGRCLGTSVEGVEGGGRNWRMAVTDVTAQVAAVAAAEAVYRELEAAHAELESRVAERTGDLQREVDERRLAEEALRNLTNQLERRVAERTEELLRAKDEAERANSGKTSFLAAASHDLRQPLQAAKLYLGVAAHRSQCVGGGGDLLPTIEKAQQSLGAVDDLLNALLDLSRADAGLIEPQICNGPVDDILRKLADEYHGYLEQPGVSFRLVPCTATIHTDPTLLQRMLGNLLANAARYTSRGRILLGCRRGKRGLRIQVWDTGMGIESDKLDAIFDEFYQIGNMERDRRRGLGLGLAVVKRLAKVLNVDVRVASTPGKGSMFELTVPGGQWPEPGEAVAMTARTPEPNVASVAEYAPPEGGLVLVIDDDPDILDALKLQLEDWGYEAMCALNADSAIACLSGGDRIPVVILADYRLSGGQTGRDAVSAVWTAVGRRVPAILLTGDTSPDRLAEARASALDLLHKPVAPAALKLAVQRGRDAGAAARAGDARDGT